MSHLLSGCHPARKWIWTLQAGAAAEMAATRKEEKYVDLSSRYILNQLW